MGDAADHKELFDSIKLIFDLTSRIDERVKILVEQYNYADQKIERLVERNEDFCTRISVLEDRAKEDDDIKKDIAQIRHDLQEIKIKSAALEITSNRHENKWQLMFEFVFRIAITLAGLYIAYKIGMK